MRILHISDIHFFKLFTMPTSLKSCTIAAHHLLFRPQHRFADQQIAQLIRQLDIIKPNLIVISGDISVSGNSKEFQHAMEILITPIHQKQIDVLIVPGNHDSFSPQSAFNFYTYIKTSCQLKKLFPNKTLEHDGLEIYRSNNINFICLDTTSTMSIWHSLGGYVGLNIVRDLDKAFAYIKQTYPYSHNVVINHFPLESKTLLHNHRITNILKAHDISCLYLCGHTHTTFLTRKSPSCIVACAGSATDYKTGHIFIIDIPDHDECVYSITDMAWNHISKEWRVLYPNTKLVFGAHKPLLPQHLERIRCN